MIFRIRQVSITPGRLAAGERFAGLSAEAVDIWIPGSMHEDIRRGT